MKENQELKMQLLKEFGESDDKETVVFCRKAYKFLTEDDEKEKSPAPLRHNDGSHDGLYLIYKDGTYCRYEEASKKTDVANIGIVQDGHAFAIAMKDLGKFPLLDDVDKCPEDHPLYKPRLCDAIYDWDCVSNTEHLKECGMKIPLQKGEYVPSLAMVLSMCHNVEALNKVLKEVGGEPFDLEECYLSSTEFNRYHARFVYFYSGNTNYYSKCNGYVVRAVTAFNINFEA